MSTSPENEFDLEKLFLPAWAQEPSASKYAKYEGEERPEGRDRRGPRGPRRDRPREGRRDQNRARDGRRDPMRPRGDQRGPQRGERGERRGAPPEGEGFRRGEPRPRREPPAPLPEVSVSLVPDEKGVESLARQIKMTGRAYPLFDIAQMILQKPERHSVVFSVRKNAEGQPLQPLFVCALDDTLWLSEDEAVAHVLKKHFNTFYQAERTATEPPKGKYTFVAQCGMSGVVLGPPNYHDYQNQLRKLHTERFSRLPFEVYKARVKIVRDEEVVKKWIDDQSWKTDYLCLNMPEPLRLGSMEAVEKHFRDTHKEAIIKPVESHSLAGTAARALRSPELVRLLRSVWEDQRRFPLQIATVLSQQFAAHGLQFFKVNKTITHVSVARPHYLDLEATPVSEGVKHIVEYVNANPKCSRRQLVETLAPSLPAATTLKVGEETQPAPPDAPTPEQTAVISDLHWLIHQGHVIEFANGTLETAKKPVPKPPKPAAAKPSEPAGEATPPADDAQAEAESTPAEPAAQSSTEPVTGPPNEGAPRQDQQDTKAQASEPNAQSPPSPTDSPPAVEQTDAKTDPEPDPEKSDRKEARLQNAPTPVESPS